MAFTKVRRRHSWAQLWSDFISRTTIFSAIKKNFPLGWASSTDRPWKKTGAGWRREVGRTKRRDAIADIEAAKREGTMRLEAGTNQTSDINQRAANAEDLDLVSISYRYTTHNF